MVLTDSVSLKVNFEEYCFKVDEDLKWLKDIQLCFESKEDSTSDLKSIMKNILDCTKQAEMLLKEKSILLTTNSALLIMSCVT